MEPLGLTVILVVFLAAWGGLALSLTPNVIRGMQSESWPSTTGIVVTTGYRTDLDPATVIWGHGATITCRFEHAGQEIEAEARNYRVFRSTPAAAVKLKMRHSPGDSVRVFYDPDDPTHFTLEPGVSWANMALCAAAWAGFLYGLGSLVLAT